VVAATFNTRPDESSGRLRQWEMALVAATTPTFRVSRFWSAHPLAKDSLIGVQVLQAREGDPLERLSYGHAGRDLRRPGFHRLSIVQLLTPHHAAPHDAERS
jgi:hypothetical protein